MSGNSIGKLFTVTSFGESHGTALGCIVDGCPPGLSLCEDDLQRDLDRRKPGQSRFTTQRREDDAVKILSGVFEGKTTGTPIGLLIENTDQRSKDYSKIKDLFRPAHADYTYEHKYGTRDYRGGGRSSARETAMRVAAGAITIASLISFIMFLFLLVMPLATTFGAITSVNPYRITLMTHPKAVPSSAPGSAGSTSPVPAAGAHAGAPPTAHTTPLTSGATGPTTRSSVKWNRSSISASPGACSASVDRQTRSSNTAASQV